MALGNNNYIGYVSKTLLENKVRFIEAAIVCPVWTSLICYYLEEDHGHLMKEEMQAGIASECVGIFPSLLCHGRTYWIQFVEHTKELLVPHPPEVLAHVVRLHMKIRGEDAEVSKSSRR